MVEEGLDEVGAPVLIVEIVGVLPDVAGEDWRLAVRQGGVGVAGADHLQVIAVLHQPDPAAAELADALRSDEHTSELQSLMRTSSAVFLLNKKKLHQKKAHTD